MSSIVNIFLIFVFCTGFVSAQIQISFDNVELSLTSIHQFKDGSNSNALPEFNFYSDYLNCSDYAEFKSFFLPGECKIPLESFMEWRSQMETATHQAKSHYEFELPNKTLHIIQYEIIRNNTVLLSPLAFFEINGKFSLMNRSQSEHWQVPKFFFSLLSSGGTQFLHDELTLDKKTTNILTEEFYGDGKLEANKLYSINMHRFSSKHQHYNLSRNLFEPQIRMINQIPQSAVNQVKAELSAYKLSNNEKDMVIQMIMELQFPRAAELIQAYNPDIDIMTILSSLQHSFLSDPAFQNN